jgi:hypothetical protein
MRAFLVLCSIAGLAACDPYSPDLGPRPFRCGTDDPECPSGYQCVEHSPTERFCERSGGNPDDPDSGNPIECDDDSSIEPNDTTDQAWVTPIPDSMPTVSLVQLSICPSSDKDLYRFGVQVNGKNLHVTVETESSGALALQILNGAGAVIANGAQTSDTRIDVAVNNLSIGTYFVQVAAASPGDTDNSTLDIVTCDGAPC